MDVHITRIGDTSIKFDCPSAVSVKRAETVLQKEPGTIAWLDSFSPGDIFWDIGSNIGVYALYAAMLRNCRVLAFEPAAANYFGLNNNILLNGADELIQAFCVALDRNCRLDAMRMRDNVVGSALHVFGESRDFRGKVFVPAWLQGALSVSIDALVEQFDAPVPNHIKIDVDGLEVAVVEGGARTFANPDLRSVLVEVDMNDHAEVDKISSVLTAGGLERDDHVPGNAIRLVKGARIFNLVHRRPQR
jgi:FkbM family methyltransferase